MRLDDVNDSNANHDMLGREGEGGFSFFGPLVFLVRFGHNFMVGRIVSCTIFWEAVCHFLGTIEF